MGSITRVSFEGIYLINDYNTDKCLLLSCLPYKFYDILFIKLYGIHPKTRIELNKCMTQLNNIYSLIEAL